MSAIGVITLICFFIANHSLSIAAQQTIPAVIDTNGKQLQSGAQYYILSFGSGATFVKHNRSSCPPFVGLSRETRVPVVFTPFVKGETRIRESRDFTIRFSASATAAATTCGRSLTKWALESTPESMNRTLITTTSRNADAVYLRIRKDDNGYKLVFCPTDVCPICRFRCGDVGVYDENGSRFLALYAPSFPVVFERKV